jgi:DNA polymerase I-like protein with 3'-5' exonuclease and polymerase domains
VNEATAERALKIFHNKQPKIQGIFHAEVIECLKSKRRLTAPLPWGIDAERGGIRIFYERWGDDLFREAFSYLPQRTVTDNTKAAGIRIKKQFPDSKIILEGHDSLLFSIKERYLEDFVPVAKLEMERPINFRCCSLPRRPLRIPCEVEVGENYKDLKKFKQHDIVEEKEVVTRILTITEKFLA